ncbi:DUF4058 family protein [Iningainema tapete]|uniref:DUF4058 family protein n=1 Tax=Iningainema tapete BLCC-T55 TaxID=2748662 RepID=A0A8J7BY52_9CYAN|nr:DUF4058 family protein [Iningainema tapete]MBD2773733.1 DUF4058 family protein [Iningainema tapete BLCC-T55]
MVLLDHFHPPLSQRRHWHAFHNAWATYIASDLNQRLPQGYFAEPNVQFGIEIDVAAFEESVQAGVDLPIDAQQQWKPPKPSQTLSFQPTSEAVEISIFNSEAGPILAGAIELVSPANKDRPKHQDAFVAKCQTYLQQGIGLVVVDVVTSRNANLHDALIAKIGTIAPQTSRANAGLKRDIGLYAVAYRVVERSNQSSLDIWLESFSIGEKLPTLPLWLRGELCMSVDLNATYDRTCREQRILLL